VDKIIRKISDILKEKERTYSFEFFPPKTREGREKLTETASIFKELGADWFSVTYGAGGTTREFTDAEATYKAGVQFTVQQCNELLEARAPGLHFYTLNKVNPTREILDRIKR